jgi:choline-sulfatase
LTWSIARDIRAEPSSGRDLMMKAHTQGRFGALLLLFTLAGSAGPRANAQVPADASAQAPAPTKAAPAKPAATRTNYDFLANRAHAVVHRDGRLVISAGEVGFLKFVDGGWKSSWVLGTKDGGKPVAFVSGLSASLFVPVDSDGDGVGGKTLADVKLALTMRALVPKQRLSVFVNEKAVGTFDVPATSSLHEVNVPASALVRGENKIRLTFRGAGPIAGGRRAAAAVERIELGTGAPAKDTLTVGEVTLGERQRAFSLAGPSRLSFYVQVPKGGRLAAFYGTATPGTTAVVRVSRDGATPATIFEGPAPAKFAEGSWDLAAFADQAVRIDFVSRGGGISWGTPRLLVKAPEPAIATKGKIEHIYIWMVDTLRADKVHVFNPKTNVITPNYDAFAADSTRFAWAAVPGTWSLPSHASILTGVYPTVHKATAHEARLDPQIPFVAELMKHNGFRTAMFSSNGYVSQKWGFGRGWDENRNFIRENKPNGAPFLWKTAKPWIQANKSKPEFVYLATVEPHVIYNPKKEFLVKYWPKPYKGPIKPALTGLQLGLIKSGKLKVTDTDKAYIEALHNAEITESDAAFKTFIADLKAAGLYDTSAIVVISDHGDEFWDHGDVGHAQSVHQELVHIPLIIHAPGFFPAGKVVDADVEAMDLFPTLLELAGVPIPPGTQGSSLLALARDEEGGQRAAMSQNLGMSRGVKSGRFRFIHSGARLELYDELSDPREQTDLVAKRPIALRQMRNVFSLLVAFENRWKKRAWGTAANLNESFYAGVGS